MPTDLKHPYCEDWQNTEQFPQSIERIFSLGIDCNSSITDMFVSIASELRWLAKWVRPYLRWHIGSFLAISLSSVLSLVTPLILKWLIDDVLPNRQAGLLTFAIALIFLCHVCRALFTSIASYLASNAVQRLSLGLRLRLVEHFDTLSASYYEKTPVGMAMYPLQEPVDEIAYFGSDLVPAILRTLMAVTFTLAIMVILNPCMTLALLPLFRYSSLPRSISPAG